MADEGKLAADGSPVDPEIVSEDDSGSVNHRDEPGAGAQERRFTGTIWPRQEHDLAGADVEVDAREGREASEQADGGSKVDGEAHASESRLPGAGSVPPRRPEFSSTFREAFEAAGRDADLEEAAPRPQTPPPAPSDPDEVAAEALAGASARASAAHVERPAPAATPRRRRRLELASILSVTGRTLIALGLLVLGFVAFELLGTNLAEARDQATLKDQLTVPPPPVDLPTSQLTEEPAPPPPPIGSAVAQIRIPRIGLDKAVVEGVDLSDLRKGPGHYANTPLPGQPGNSAIAGHRTTYGAPFFRLDEMRPGDPIFVSTTQGAFRYEVVKTFVVKPTQVDVLNATTENLLTLTTCNPRFSAAQRLVVVAALKGPAAKGTPLPRGADPAVIAGTPPPAIQEVVGASGDPAERVPSALWGTVVLALGIAGAILGRLWRRWPSWILTAIPFVPALWTFYTHLAKAVPS